MLIRGVDYPFYKSLYDMMTSRTIRIYAIMDEILSEETIRKLENKEQSEMVALLHSLMLTHQKCRILANMIDCPKEISENEIFDELMSMKKSETDAAMVFFLTYIFQEIMQEKAQMILTHSMQQEKKTKPNP